MDTVGADEDENVDPSDATAGASSGGNVLRFRFTGLPRKTRQS